MNGIESGWFYSSLAQTSSSIVGLVGAVLGMHTIEHLSVMREERRELMDRINSLYKHLNDRCEHWVLFKNYLKQEIALGNAPREIKAQITWEGHEENSKIIDMALHHSNAVKDLELLEQVMLAYVPLDGMVNEADISVCVASLRKTANVLPPHSKAAHILLIDASLLDKLKSRFSRFHLKLFPRPFVVVLLVLAWLFLTGVLWPLCVLPGFTGAFFPKGVMLTALAAGVLALVGYFASQLRELARLGRIYWKKPR